MPHGPCSSGNLGDLEYDEAHCFASDYWPPSAYYWIDRSHSWPQKHVRNSIISAGCHFVAIGHKKMETMQTMNGESLFPRQKTNCCIQ